jgi:hypothetical protein
MGVARNEIALPQIEVMVQGPSAHILAGFIGANRQRLTDLFVEAELEWEAAQLRRKFSKTTLEALQEVSGHTICVPTGLRASKQGKDFLWTGTNLLDKDQNFVFYSYPWNGHPLSIGQYVAKRDSVLKTNIPGSEPNQWMQTNPEFVWTKNISVAGQFAMEARGLWEMKNDAMGGPFISHSRLDEKNNRVIVVEGFVYAPDKMKRTMLRRLEAALYTLETPNKEADKQKD